MALDPVTPNPIDGTFAARLYEQLSPFQTLDDNGHLWVLCDAIGAMFQSYEDLVATRDSDGLSGYATLLDIDNISAQQLGFLAQFIGARLKPGLSDVDQRAWVKSAAGMRRGRPASIIAAVQATLTGTQSVILRERDGSAWKFSVVVKPAECPNTTLTTQAMMSQKPGPDQATLLLENTVDYEWVKDNELTYQNLKDGFATYGDLAHHTF